MKIGTIDLNKLRGISDKAVGLGKEAFGVVLSNENWQREGVAQQERASAELKGLQAELKAEQAEVKAQVAEKREVMAQKAKAS